MRGTCAIRGVTGARGSRYRQWSVREEHVVEAVVVRAGTRRRGTRLCRTDRRGDEPCIRALLQRSGREQRRRCRHRVRRAPMARGARAAPSYHPLTRKPTNATTTTTISDDK